MTLNEVLTSSNSVTNHRRCHAELQSEAKGRALVLIGSLSLSDTRTLLAVSHFGLCRAGELIG